MQRSAVKCREMQINAEKGREMQRYAVKCSSASPNPRPRSRPLKPRRHSHIPPHPGHHSIPPHAQPWRHSSTRRCQARASPPQGSGRDSGWQGHREVIERFLDKIIINSNDVDIIVTSTMLSCRLLRERTSSADHDPPVDATLAQKVSWTQALLSTMVERVDGCKHVSDVELPFAACTCSSTVDLWAAIELLRQLFLWRFM